MKHQERATETDTATLSGDLLIITPSRGRPKNIARLLDSVHDRKRLQTHVCVAIDDDDPDAGQYRYVMDKAGQGGDVLKAGPRKGLTAWTNEIAAEYADKYRYLASFGDDMVPRTPGWDRALVRAITDMGGTGMAYPWTATREDIGEAIVMSSDIVAALGWMALPECSHWFIDDAWTALGHGAGCIRHLRAVAVDHLRGALGQAAADETSRDAGKRLEADEKAYYAWRHDRMAADIATVVKLRERVLQAA